MTKARGWSRERKRLRYKERLEFRNRHRILKNRNWKDIESLARGCVLSRPGLGTS
jgi:hypothetical protein